MKNSFFRPVEFWKSACITMPDNSFYELLRSVFGKIKTPFNKQQLLNDLETFLLREDIQKTIASYIDQTDAKIITAAALFGEPVSGELESFFSDELSFAQMQDIIVNLEERFIIYRFTEDKTTYLALNPVLEPVLQPIVSDTSVLFPAISKAASPAAIGAKPIVNDLIIAGLFSFVSCLETFFKPDGGIRKRVIEEGKTIFPGIDLKNILDTLQILGLFYADGDRLIPDRKRFDDFGLLSARERMGYCSAALLVYDELTPPFEILPPLFRNRIRELVHLINNFLDSLKTGHLYPETTLKRMIEVHKKRLGSNFDSGKLLEALEKTGLVINGAVIEKNTAKSDSASIVINSSSSILVYPEIEYTDAFNLAAFTSIKETGAVVRFEISKESAVRAFDKNLSADEIIELLNRLSGNKNDNALIWNLKDWEKRYGEVSLKKGVILSLSQELRYLSDTKSLASLIIENLAPGLYLLNENAMDNAADVLQKAGIDIVARRKETQKHPVMASSNYFSSLSALSVIFFKKNYSSLAMDSSAPQRRPAVKDISGQKKSEFRALLEKMPLSELERTELSARIDRRLVICEAQLKDANIRYEKLEARHMDYTGKQHIAKQAVSQRSPVEIVWTSKGKEKRFFGIPQTLEKEGNELILVVDAMRIPLAKIGLLRRIKKSIFEK